jgi:hypothetical protein
MQEINLLEFLLRFPDINILRHSAICNDKANCSLASKCTMGEKECKRLIEKLKTYYLEGDE